MILLYHPTTTHGMVATSENKVAGEHYPARRYHHTGHYIELDGPAHVIAYDAAVLEGHGYRLATPAEQERYTAAKRGTSAIHEDTSGLETNVPANETGESAALEPTSEPQVLTTANAPATRRAGRK